MGGCLIACSHSFHFTLALQQLDNQSLWKHPVYPPGPMLNACVQRWLLGDSHVCRLRTFCLAGKWARVSRYSRLSSYTRFPRHPSYLATLGLLAHRWGAAIFSPFHLFTLSPLKGAAIFSPFHSFTFSPLNVSFSYKNVSWTIFASIWTIIACLLHAVALNLPPQKMGRKRNGIDINQLFFRAASDDEQTRWPTPISNNPTFTKPNYATRNEAATNSSYHRDGYFRMRPCPRARRKR